MQINTSCFNQFPILKTKRLTLRNLIPNDASKIHEMRTNGRVNEFIPRNNKLSLDDAENLVHKTNHAYKSKLGIGWAGILREEKEIIGSCGFNSIDYSNLRAEIGGELAVDYWGKSIALEAVTAIIDFGLTKMKFHTIEAKVSPQNRGAIHLMELIGFKKEAEYIDRIYFNEEFLDMAVYTLISGQENQELIESYRLS